MPSKPPTGTVAVPENATLVNLKEREQMFLDKIARLEKLDANEQLRGGIDINEVKRKTQLHLAAIRSLIQKESK